jgi:splicing factor 3A subunit 3
MLALKDNPKEKSMLEHQIANFTTMIQQKSQQVLGLLREESAMRKEELAVIEGHRSLKQSDKKKPADVIWQNFYDKCRELKEHYRRGDDRQQLTPNTVDFFRRMVFQPPFKEPEFSMEEGKGRFVDMHSLYLQYFNLFITFEGRENLKLHDYLWYLQNFDKFDDFTLNKKMKHHAKYLIYLRELSEYLDGFMRRARPLFGLEDYGASVRREFEAKYAESRVHGWEPELDSLDETEWQFCAYC